MRLRNLKSQISNRRSQGFTLLELLTVIVIIVMLIGVAALAFNTITGRRSTSMAQNQIAAMLSQMRAMAMNDVSVNPMLYGVLFYYDPNIDRAVMQPITVSGLGDADPNDPYKAWVPSLNATYQVGDRVVAITRDYDPSQPLDALTNPNKPVAIVFLCIQQPSNNRATYPPDYVSLSNWASSDNRYWVPYSSQATGLDLLDMPSETLPAGVGVQVLADPVDTVAMGATGYPERYLETGIILFDNSGKVATQRCYITAASSVQRRLGATSAISGFYFYSQAGLAIYDRESFLAATHTAAGTTFTPTDQDYLFQTFGGAQPNATDEMNEEQWLDENGKLLAVDRMTGELTDIRK